jgi:anaerobic nitric oxide reductase flavorubredoxin
MKAHAIGANVHAIHANIDAGSLFEGIWPIPHGVTLNSYLVQGERTALIDLAKDWDNSIAQFEEQLASAGSSFEKIDHLILNHLEPDHTGWILEIRKKNPKVEIISTPKGIAMVRNFFKITDNLREVKSGDTLDLGNGTVLDFIETPNIHWPETMMTYERTNKILFSCDGFGAFGSLGDRLFDDEFTAEEHAFFEHETLRYYSNIVSSFSGFVTKALEKLKTLDIAVVAPSHGIVWRKNPEAIIAQYARYAGYNSGGACEKEIAIIWGSMYGYTKKGLDAVIAGIESEGVPYTLHQVPDENASFGLADAYKSAGLVIAMPTYEYKMFPPMAHMLDLFDRKHVTGKKVLRIGSWGWVGGAKKEYEERIAGFKWTNIESVEWQGVPSEAELAVLKERGAMLARQVKEA